MSLALYEDGPALAPPVVLLHPIATSSAVWNAQLAPLASAFRVLRLDLPGHGASEMLPMGASFADYADAVGAALDARGVRSACVVGLSFGAMVALRLAVLRPDLVGRLVMACCTARTAPPVSAIWRERVDAVDAAGMETQVEPTLQRWFTHDYAAASPVTLGWVGGLIHSTPPAGFAAAATLIAALDHLPLLPELRMPVLALAGEHDTAAPPAAMRDFASSIPDARFATLPAAHLANVEAPCAFTEAVGRFAAP